MFTDWDKETRPLLSDPTYSWRFNVIRSKRSYFTWKLNLVKYSLLWVFAFIVYFLVILCVTLVYYNLPTPVGDDSNHHFSEVRARKYLSHFVNDIGPHSIGTVKNKVALEYILDELKKIRNGSYDEYGNPRISYEIRNHYGNSQMYRNVWWKDINNVVAVLHGKHNYSNSDKFLISAHYDTVTLSSGAFDDSSGVSILLELLYVFSNLPKMEIDLVVLFNNGEELGLIGASDFAFFDDLFQQCVGFINIDSTPGWKPLLFRSTGSWLDSLIAQLPRPFGSVFAQDLFNLRFVNSDTDYTIYSQDGHPGLDFAFFGHRQTYHTLKDTTLPDGAIQYHGDNLFKLLEIILSKENLRTYIQSHKEPNVYFDVLNLFAVVYPIRTGFILHCVLAACFLFFIPIALKIQYNWWRKQPMATREQNNPCLGTVYEFFKLLLSILVGLSLSYLVGYMIKQFNPRFYRSSVGWAVCTFLFTTMAGICMVQFAFAFVLHVRGYPPPNYSHAYWAVQVFWAILIIGTLPLSYRIGSTYILFYPGVFVFVGLLLHYTYDYFIHRKTQNKQRESMNESEQEEHLYQRKSSGSTRRESGGGSSGGGGDGLGGGGGVRPARRRPSYGPTWSDHSESDSEPLRSGDEPLADSDDDDSNLDDHFRSELDPLPTGIFDYIFLLLLFFLTSVPSFLVMFSIFFMILLHLTSDFPCDFTALIIALFTIIGYLNFFPLSKKANCFGTVAIIFSLGVIICILFAGFWFSPTPESPYVVGISQTSSDSNNTLTFRGQPDSPSLETFVKKDLGIDTTTQCTDWRCYCSENIPPNIQGMNYTSNILDGGLIIVFETPGSYVQELSVRATGGVFKNISVNDHLIASSIQSLDFMYILSEDTPWVLTLWLDQSDPTVTVKVSSHYNDLIYTPAIQKQIKDLPSWATFVGTGSGLTIVSSPELKF